LAYSPIFRPRRPPQMRLVRLIFPRKYLFARPPPSSISRIFLPQSSFPPITQSYLLRFFTALPSSLLHPPLSPTCFDPRDSLSFLPLLCLFPCSDGSGLLRSRPVGLCGGLERASFLRFPGPLTISPPFPLGTFPLPYQPPPSLGVLEAKNARL